MPKNDYIKRQLKRGDIKFDRDLKDIEEELMKNYREAMKAIRAEIMATAEKYGDKVELSDMLQYNRLTNLERNIADQIKQLGGQVRKLTSDSIKDFFTESFYQTGFALETGVGVKLGFGLLSPDAIRASVENKLDRIGWPKRLADDLENTNQKVRSAITQGLIRGDGLVKTSAKLEKKLDMSRNNTLRIVRTETHRVQNEGRLKAFDKTQAAADRLGLTIKRVWVSVKDSRTREDHVSADGKTTNKENKFELFGVEFDGPGLSGIAEEDINCRCTTAVEIGGLENITPDPEIESYGTFDEWKKGRIAA